MKRMNEEQAAATTAMHDRRRRVPLGAEDSAWLHMEDATNPMVVNGVLELAARLPLHEVHALVERLAAKPRFRAQLDAPTLRIIGPPSWTTTMPAAFDVSQHVEHVTLDSASDAALCAFIGGAVSKLLDETRPLWRIYVIDRPNAGTTLLVRVHHAMADGFALLGVLLSLCDDDPPTTTSTIRRATPQMRQHPMTMGSASAASAKALRRLVMLPADPKTVLKGSLGLEKKVAWSAPLDLQDIKRVARIANATVNDVLVATAAGALRRYLARRGDCVDALGDLHAMVPVNLRTDVGGTTTTTTANSHELGNRFGLVLLGLPIGCADPLARVAAVKERMDALKATPEAVVAHALLCTMGWVPRPVEDLAVTFLGKKASLVLSNVPGPRAPLKLAGVPVSRIMFWVPQSGRMGLGISIFSYAGKVTIGVLSDAALVPDPDALVLDLHAELAALVAEVPSVRQTT